MNVPPGAEEATKRLDEYARSLESRSRDTGSPWKPGLSLPLHEVDFSLTVEPQEFQLDSSWPPARFGDRQSRLELYHRWSRGDMRDMIDQALLDISGVAATNVFGRLVQFTSDLMLREAPSAGQEDGTVFEDKALHRIAHDLVKNAIIYGAAFLLYSQTREGPIMRVVDSRYVLPRTDQGWLIAEPRTSPGTTSAVPDVMLVQNIDPGGSTTMGVYTNAYSTLSVGPTTVVPSVIGESMVIPVLAYPTVADYWGTSWFDNIATQAVQRTRRLAGNALVLDANSTPIFQLTANTGANPYKVGEGGKRPVDVEAEAYRAARQKHAGVMVVSDQSTGGKYLTWDGNLDPSQKHIDQNDKDFQLMTGLPSALTDGTAVPSGVALKQVFWVFDTRVTSLYREVKYALKRVLKKQNLELEWENVFEEVETNPELQSRQAVMDESTARRGEGDAESVPDTGPTEG